MKTFFKSLLLKLNGQVSKSKATMLVGLLLTGLQAFGIINLTNEQAATATAALLALWGIFARSGMEEESQSVVHAVKTSELRVAGAVDAADTAARKAATEASETPSVALAAAKKSRGH